MIKPAAGFYEEMEDMKAILVKLHPFIKSEHMLIAGGAIRDAYMGVPRKDIDIFILHEGLEGFVKYQDTLTEKGETPSINEEWDYTANGAEGQVVYGDLNFVLLSANIQDQWQCIERFDFDICKIGYSLNQGVMIDGAALQDMENKTFTCRLAPYDEERPTKRFMRIAVRYPGFTFVDAIPKLEVTLGE